MGLTVEDLEGLVEVEDFMEAVAEEDILGRKLSVGEDVEDSDSAEEGDAEVEDFMVGLGAEDRVEVGLAAGSLEGDWFVERLGERVLDLETDVEPVEVLEFVIEGVEEGSEVADRDLVTEVEGLGLLDVVLLVEDVGVEDLRADVEGEVVEDREDVLLPVPVRVCVEESVGSGDWVEDLEVEVVAVGLLERVVDLEVEGDVVPVLEELEDLEADLLLEILFVEREVKEALLEKLGVLEADMEPVADLVCETDRVEVEDFVVVWVPVILRVLLAEGVRLRERVAVLEVEDEEVPVRDSEEDLEPLTEAVEDLELLTEVVEDLELSVLLEPLELAE